MEHLDTKILLILAVSIAFYSYLKRIFDFGYWKLHGIPCDIPSIPLGNLPLSYVFGKINLGVMYSNIYEKFKNHPFHGFYAFNRPVLMLNDPALIKNVFVKEFHRFTDHGWYSNEAVDPMCSHLFLLSGTRWKFMRSKLTPLFTSSKLKQMYNLVVEVGNELTHTFNSELEKSNIVEVKDIMTRYTTDIIASIVYGFNCNSLQDPHCEFRYYGEEGLNFNRLGLLMTMFLPNFLKKLSIRVHKVKVYKFFKKILVDTIDYRRENNIIRNDFLNLLMQLVDYEGTDVNGNVETESETKQGENQRITLDEAAAQAFIFFIAGLETPSSSTSLCLLELAKHPDIQDKLREEIDDMVDSTGFTYDSLMKLEYLDIVLKETTRKHPSLPFLDRLCVEDYKVPDSEYTIPKGMRIVVSSSGIQMNSEFFSDPESFDPDRFSKENSDSNNDDAYLGFGLGPRQCIGRRFGLMVTKHALAVLLRNYKFHVCEQTPTSVKYCPNSFAQMPAHGISLRLEKRDI